MGMIGRRVGAVMALVLLGSAVVAQAIDYRNPTNLDGLIARHTEEYLLLDVRTAAEFESGHIPTAVNIPYDEVAGKMAELPKDSLVIVYCASGRRASIAATTLKELGFTNVTNFGGITRWSGGLVTGSE